MRGRAIDLLWLPPFFFAVCISEESIVPLGFVFCGDSRSTLTLLVSTGATIPRLSDLCLAVVVANVDAYAPESYAGCGVRNDLFTARPALPQPA